MTNTQVRRKTARTLTSLLPSMDRMRQTMFSEYEIVSDTAFALQLPEYAASKQPFLSNAEVFYNSCLLAFNVWSNHELWLRGCDGFELAEEKDVVAGIKAISEDCIRDKRTP